MGTHNSHQLEKKDKAFIPSFVTLLVNLIIMAAGLSLPVYAKNTTPIQLIKNLESYSANGHISYLEDPEHTLHLSQVLSAYQEKSFTHAGLGVVNFGVTNSIYWFHLKVENKNSDHKNWLVEIKDPVIDLIDMYFVDSTGSIQHMQMGDHTSLNNRPIKTRTPLFKLYLEPSESMDLFFKINTAGSLAANVNVWSSDSYIKYNSNIQIIYGLFYGGAIALLLYNLMLFFSTRDMSYFYYCLFVGFNTFYLFSSDGLSYEHFWPDHGDKNFIIIALSGNITTIFILQFARIFLQVKARFKKLDLIMLYTMVANPMPLLLLTIGQKEIAVALNLLLSTISVLLVFYVGVVAMQNGVKEARYYLIAWATLIFSIIVYNLRIIGILPPMFFTMHSVHIGAVLEAILLSFALAHRMSLLKEENYRIQKEATEVLELRVEERTNDLKAAMNELSKANQLLKESSYNDGLTGVRNRSYFDEHFEIEWLRCRREKTSLALLMIDIDHFKNINDTYGHLCGDHALVSLANNLKKAIKRPNDIIARYGGEEFVVVLPNTDTEGARFLAERIRRSLEDHSLTFNNQKFNLTASIGCASMKPDKNHLNPNELIDKADKALYTAKETGRNRVHLAM